MQNWIIGVGIGLVISYGAGKIIPGYIVKKVHTWFEAAKISPWWRNPEKPWRWDLLKAVFKFFEGELPDAGTGKEFYEKWGNRIVNFLSFLPILKGTAGTWAKALEKAGDIFDTGLKEDIREME